MPRRTHPLFLEQAIQKFSLPEQNLDEIKRYLRSEQHKNESLALKIAEAEGKLEKISRFRELSRQKEDSDLKIEALEFARSRRGFLDTLQQSRRRKRRSKGQSMSKRQKLVRATTSAGVEEQRKSLLGKKGAINGNTHERQQLLNDYKQECKDRGIRVTNVTIAQEAGWSDRTAVQRWLRNDPRSTSGEDARIRRVLREKPHLK